MLERLGHVCGWTGDMLASLLCLAAAYGGATGGKDAVFLLILLGTAAGVVFLIGRALRYIFAGEWTSAYDNIFRDALHFVLTSGATFRSVLPRNKGEAPWAPHRHSPSNRPSPLQAC